MPKMWVSLSCVLCSTSHKVSSVFISSIQRKYFRGREVCNLCAWFCCFYSLSPESWVLCKLLHDWVSVFKAIQWGADGRPFHFLFYTSKQSYYSLMHVSTAGSCQVFMWGGGKSSSSSNPQFFLTCPPPSPPPLLLPASCTLGSYPIQTEWAERRLRCPWGAATSDPLFHTESCSWIEPGWKRGGRLEGGRREASRMEGGQR